MIKISKIFYFCSVIMILSALFACTQDYSAPESYVKPEKESKKSVAVEESQTETETEQTPEEGEDEAFYEAEDEPETISVKPWTFLVYMAADNNLEGDAIADLNEMEHVDFSDAANVLVLFDRAEGFDASNGDWTDTRLYKVVQDEEENQSLIASERLGCEELGLSPENTTELDMSNPLTLSGFLSFSRRAYPAENYALIIWGHGTGWRSVNDVSNEKVSSRAVAIDSSSDSYMTISQLRSAIEKGMDGVNLEVIGFDTCFGLCIENAFELSQCAKYMMGTPALVSESGWNYRTVFSDFMAGKKTVHSFIDCVSESFVNSYQNYPYASFACVDLKKIPDIVQEFSSFSKNLAKSINSKSSRNRILSAFTDGCISYFATSYPTDFYVDLKDLILHTSSGKQADKLVTLIDDSLVFSWSANGDPCSLALFFCVYRSCGVIQASHPSMYVNGSRDPLLSRFVINCTGYVPTAGCTGSLLDRLFYTNY